MAQDSGTVCDDVVENTERAVLKVLTGTPLTDTAIAERIEPTELAEAVELYQRAGRHALAHQLISNWWQFNIQFTDWNLAEQTAAHHLAPLLQRAEDDGVITTWWFMRKHPCWRVRLHPTPTGRALKHRLDAALDDLAAARQIARWSPGIYEAETAAFGGDTGADIAHHLFCEDSKAVMDLLRGSQPALGRRELTLLLCSILLRAAGLEWYEQGDVWHRVAKERPLPTDIATAKLTALADDLKHLIVADTTPTGPLLRANGPLASIAEWAEAFRQAGRTLGAAARAGTLERGLRDVLSYQVIFHWNRLGLPARTQSILAGAARAATLTLRPAPTSAPTDRAPRTASRSRPSAAARTAADRAMRRFPLVLQGHRRCADLETRVREVRSFAESCSKATTPDDRVDRACSVWNLSALIATDCGLPALAVEWSQQQAQLLQTAWPVSSRVAIASLQPLVNLARLTRRSGDPEGAHRALKDIHRAVLHERSATVHGNAVPFNKLMTADSDRCEVRSWLRKVLREDGTRALAAAGRWAQAAAHAEQYEDPGDQLREARQTRIIANVLDERPDTALELIDTSMTREPWEQAVAACLRIYTQMKAERLDTHDPAAMVHAARRAQHTSERATTLFQTRLGLAVLDLAADLSFDHTELVRTELIKQTTHADDAYSARELLSHPIRRAQMTPEQVAALTTISQQAGLDSGSIPQPLLDALMISMQSAGKVLSETLT